MNNIEWAGLIAGSVIITLLIAVGLTHPNQAQAQQTGIPYNAFNFSCQQLQGLINSNLTVISPNSGCGTATCVAVSGMANAYLQIYAGKGCYNQT